MSWLRHNLLLQFSIVSLVVMAAIGFGLSAVLSSKIRSDAIHALVDEAIGASSGRLLSVFTPEDLEAPMTGARYESFHRFVQQQIVSKRTARIKIWAKDGTVIYDANPAKIGQRFPDKAGLLAALRGETFTELNIPRDTEHAWLGDRHRDTIMEVYAPIVFPGTTDPQGAFEFYQYFAPTAQLIYALRQWAFGSVGVGFVLLYAGLVSLVWRGWRTIVRQQKELESFNTELERQVQDRTTALREAQERLVRTERLAAIGELSAGVAHELRNPLGAIKNATYYLKGKIRSSDLAKDPRANEFLDIMDEEIEASNRIITDLMDFSRVNPAKLTPARLDTVIENALSRTEIKKNVSIIKEFQADLPEVLADSEQLRRAFVNLIKNADEAMPQGGALSISGKAVNGFVELQFRDTGQGISDADLAKIFDPLYTTKARGIGLGLAIVKQIIDKHTGCIEVTSEQGKGAAFTVTLPANRG